MKKMTQISNIIRLLFLSLLIKSFFCEEIYTEDSMKYDKSIRGIGVGTAVVISFIIIGAIIIIYGLSTAYPVLFIIIGIGLPLIVFLILMLVPQSDKEEEEKNKLNKNTHKDVYMIAKWVYFTFMLLLFIGLIAIKFIEMQIVIIPERVDSRAQKEMDMRYLRQIERQRKRKAENPLNKYEEEDDKSNVMHMKSSDIGNTSHVNRSIISNESRGSQINDLPRRKRDQN